MKVKDVAARLGVGLTTVRRAVKAILPHEGIEPIKHNHRGTRKYVTYIIDESAIPAIRVAVRTGRDTRNDKPRTAQPKKARRSMLPSIDPDASFMDSTYYEAGIALNGIDPYEK
jgi:hypothetical protein